MLSREKTVVSNLGSVCGVIASCYYGGNAGGDDASARKEPTNVADRNVQYRAEEGVGWVTLDRPEVMNALSEQVFRHLFDIVRDANDDPAVRVLVVTGAGPNFKLGLNGIGDMLGVAANHEAGIVTKAVAAGYADEVSGFFRTGKAERRPVPAPSRARS